MFVRMGVCVCVRNDTTQTWMLSTQNKAEISEGGSKHNDTADA